MSLSSVMAIATPPDVLQIARTEQMGNAMFLSKAPFHAGSSDVTDPGNARKLAFATHPGKTPSTDPTSVIRWAFPARSPAAGRSV